jgi:ATP-dependent Lon protease
MADKEKESRELKNAPSQPEAAQEQAVKPIDSPPEGEQNVKIPEILPLLPIRDVVIFPYMIIPLFVGRENSVAAVNESLSKDRMIMLATQKNSADENPGPEQLFEMGTAGMIMRMLRLPDGRVKILVQGLNRARVKEFLQKAPFYQVRIELLEETPVKEVTVEIQALMRNIKENLEKMIQMGRLISPDLLMVLESITDPGRFCDLIAANIGMSVEDAQKLMQILDPVPRLHKLYEIITREMELLEVQAKIQNQAKEEMTKTQREYYLREQLRAIQKELGEVDEKAQEVAEFREKIEKCKMPKEAEEEALKQLKKLETMHPDAVETSWVRGYLEWMVELPWSKSTHDNLDIKRAEEILNQDHYDLDKVKERILEYLSVRKLHPQMKGPILCFVGAPGVGKTSLGQSIARAMGRKFIRMSLGGIRDEAEIRGHRRTYVGAMPGRIIQGIKTAGSNNPVFMLDEIDKLGADFRGDPSAALLEVLDPEQNSTFRDHYINLPFDLSKVMFILTANITDTIPAPLLDRMEMLELPGYTLEEKLQIAKRYLIPRQMKENGMSEKLLAFEDEAVREIISQYTREAGVRNLERFLGAVCRKVARKVAEGNKEKAIITANSLVRYLGAPKFLPEEEMDKDEVGVVTGLAWTGTGGDILRVEVSIVKERKNLILTGHLGEVMKESAQAGLSYAKRIAPKFGLASDYFEDKEVHIHVPAGAIPKDGPSAGVTMATALVSAMTGIPVKKNVAMTGEITLRGRVLPIGGLKEKALAALRSEIRNVLIPERNRKDLEDIPPEQRKEINFIFAKTMEDVLDASLVGGLKAAMACKTKPAASSKNRKTRKPRKSAGRD